MLSCYVASSKDQIKIKIRDTIEKKFKTKS